MGWVQQKTRKATQTEERPKWPRQTWTHQLMQNFLAGTLAPQLPHLTLLLMFGEAGGEHGFSLRCG